MEAEPRFPTHSHVSLKDGKGCFYCSPATQNPFPPLGNNESTISIMLSLKHQASLRWKCPLRGKEVKERVEGVGEERWSHIKVLRDLRESGHVVGEKNVGPFLAVREPRYRLLETLFWWGEGGGNDGLRGGWNSGRMVEITLSQKEKYPSARMKQPVMVLTSLKGFHKYA